MIEKNNSKKNLQKSANKPLSPHIQIYKPQISSFTSILHRMTGIFLYLGLVIISWAIVYYTYQVEVLTDGAVEDMHCDCLWMKIIHLAFDGVVIAWIFSLYYHLCNGIRHLFWDIGKGFDKKVSNRNGILVLVISSLLTIGSIVFALFTYNI